MKINKGKGKVHPSPSHSSATLSSPPTGSRDAFSALKLLPASILSLIAVLSFEDREVLDYMITRSMKATASPSCLLEQNRKRKSRNPAPHKSPLFDCGCFECYTSYWFRWDSSPNRELIHQAIEAFEEHLDTDEQSKKAARGKRRERVGGRRHSESSRTVEGLTREALGASVALGAPENEDRKAADTAEDLEGTAEVAEAATDEAAPPSPAEAGAVSVRAAAGEGNHYGLARKVLPDVIGLLNSRLWGLWSPNV
ncbi:hypothetical protein Nepgr_016946 [Nepenthes gracilis]|uniref:Uncharacterized protein n=1 Tax=Nepenthes gracilis TaxID=150966 RepID=A0AAD3XSY4_NEPGR|nr:hypothetical protein Nepgr_016946 [Nepenthes gracilis]